MTILYRYLWKNALSGIIMAWFALILLDSFFSLINELEDTGINGYSTADAVLYVIYTLPMRLYEYFPTSILVGALLGLGKLSANSEFTAMRAAGISIKQITIATLQLGIFLALLTFILGEWVVPAADRYAANFKALQKNNKVAVTVDRGLWVKENHELIKIGQVISDQSLADITIYRVNSDYKKLKDITTIDSATYKNKQWVLQRVTTRTFSKNAIKQDQVDTAYTSTLINPDVLKVTAANPEQLTSKQLLQLIKHQEKNSLNADKFKLAFWKHFSIPFSALVMLMLAMPFLFSSQRSAGTGQRLFIGISVGVVFFLINRVLNEMGIVYNFSPLISAFLPVILFLFVSILALKRVK